MIALASYRDDDLWTASVGASRAFDPGEFDAPETFRDAFYEEIDR